MIRERLELVMVEILIIGGWYYGLLLAAADCSFCSSYFFDYFTEHKILQCFKFTVKYFFKNFLHFFTFSYLKKRNNFENLDISKI